MNGNVIYSIILLIALSSCATLVPKNGQAQWDFDHNIQFKQQQLTDNKYHITVRATDKTNFATLATFLMRHSLNLCQNYGFKIEVLAGVESYNHKLESPNKLMSSLSANVECPAK
jgi:hypothetical protein